MIWQWFTDHFEYCLFIAIVAGFLALLVRQHFLNKAPEYVASATVLSRRMGNAKCHARYTSGYNYLVTFRLGENDTLELYVTGAQYAALTEGLRGNLRWQDENLLSFEPDLS